MAPAAWVGSSVNGWTFKLARSTALGHHRSRSFTHTWRPTWSSSSWIWRHRSSITHHPSCQSVSPATSPSEFSCRLQTQRDDAQPSIRNSFGPLALAPPARPPIHPPPRIPRPRTPSRARAPLSHCIIMARAPRPQPTAPPPGIAPGLPAQARRPPPPGPPPAAAHPLTPSPTDRWLIVCHRCRCCHRRRRTHRLA